MFQDEARFGRISNPLDCWAPKRIRPEVTQQIIREYTYAYAAVSPLDGRMDSLILPDMYASTMGVFLEEISKRYPDEYVFMVTDGAACHRSGELQIPKNIELCQLPPYSPNLNPQENIWDEMREKYFSNRVFESMDAVEFTMIEALMALENDPERIKKITGWPWILKAIS